MWFRGFVFLSLVAASPVIAQTPASEPSTQPTAPATTQHATGPWRRMLDALRDPNPETREAAREELMTLSREELPALADVARDAGPLLPTQRALLREIVEQVYLTGEHHFAGVGSGYIGISDMQAADVQSVITVRRRLPGYDAYRVLQLGDVILSAAPLKAGAAGLKPTAGIASLKSILSTSVPGDWVLMHIARNGVERDVMMRLGPVPPQQADQQVIIPSGQAAKYWTDTFAKRLAHAPTTAPHA